jgi:predicted Abi (CAAX) family protease
MRCSQEFKEVKMFRRKRLREDQKVIDTQAKSILRLTDELEGMVTEVGRLREEVKQRDEVIAGLRKELPTKDED